MILKYNLSEKINSILPKNMQKTKDEDPIVYAVPYNLDKSAKIIEDSYLIISRTDIALVQENELFLHLKIDELEDFKLENSNDGGFLYASAKERTDAAKGFGAANEYFFILRFTNRYLVQMSYLARGVQFFIEGEDRILISKEKEEYCPNCGEPLLRSTVCTNCTSVSGRQDKLVQLILDYKKPLAIVMIPIVVMIVVNMIQTFMQRFFIDDVILNPNATGGDVAVFSIAMLVVAGISLVAFVARELLANRFGTNLAHDLRNRVFVKLNDLPLSYIDSFDVGELMNRVMRDTDVISRFTRSISAMAVSLIFELLVVFVIMFLVNWRLALITLVFMPIVLLLSELIRTKYRNLWRREWRQRDKADAKLQDVLTGIRVVKSFGQEKQEIDAYNNEVETLARYSSEAEVFYSTIFPVITFFATAGSILMTGIGGYEVIMGITTPGELTQMLGYAAMIFNQINFLTRLPRMLSQARTSLDRIYDILEEEEIVEEEFEDEYTLDGDIEFDNVHFSYNNYEPVLSGVSIDIKKGEKIGIVGSSGAGKSTLVNLIMKLYDIDEGDILIDGRSIADIPYTQYHNKLGVVLQESFLFNGTIAQNIKFAKPNATDAEVIEAARQANAHDFITKFTDGYDTYVGERGGKLSGGEKQRVAIARALLPNPDMLILDEPTASLDLETEVLIQEALARLTEGKTTFIIAHRLATLKDCDRIMLIDNHNIAEFATHDELMAQEGKYYDLVNAQLDLFRVE